MSFNTFINDLRKLDPPDDFEQGNDKQRVKLNKGTKFMRDLKAAADREEANNGEETFIAWVEDGGESIEYEIYGRRVGGPTV